MLAVLIMVNHFLYLKIIILRYEIIMLKLIYANNLDRILNIYETSRKSVL